MPEPLDTFKEHKLTLGHATHFAWSCSCGDGGVVHPRSGWDYDRCQDEMETRGYAHLAQMLGMGDDPYDHMDGCVCSGESSKGCPWHGYEED